MKKYLLLLFLIVLFAIVSCSQENKIPSIGIVGTVATIKDSNVLRSQEPIITASPQETMDPNMPNPPISPSPIYTPEETPTPSINGEDYINYPKEGDYIKGFITVNYNISYNIRVNQTEQKIEASDNNVAIEISNILKKYNIISMNDSSSGMDKNDNAYNDFASMHRYEFPIDTDTIKLCEELRKLSYVDKAYPQPISASGTVYQSLSSVLIGYIFDRDNKPVENAIVKISRLDGEYVFRNYKEAEIKTNISGFYSLPSVKDGVDVKIVVSKDGYKTISKTIITKPETQNIDPNNFVPGGTNATKCNFGGDKEEDKPYALEKIQ